MLRLLALLAALLATPAWAAPPTVDVQAGAQSFLPTPTSISVTITPVTSGDLFFVICFGERTNAQGAVPAATVTGVPSYTRRGSTQAFHLGSAGTPFIAIDTFYAFTSGTTADTPVCSWGANVLDNAAIMVLAISGVDPVTPFDPNVSIPKVASLSTDAADNPVITNVSTTNGQGGTLILLYAGAANSAVAVLAQSVGGSFTAIYHQIAQTNANFSGIDIEVWPTAVTQTNQTMTFSSGPSGWNGWLAISDAIQAPSSGAAAAPTRTLLGVGK